jgi:hypothetical protein
MITNLDLRAVRSVFPLRPQDVKTNAHLQWGGFKAIAIGLLGAASGMVGRREKHRVRLSGSGTSAAMPILSFASLAQ